MTMILLKKNTEKKKRNWTWLPDILILCNESKIHKFLITIKIITYFIHN